jgi:Tfp pilus assembly protein PilO
MSSVLDSLNLRPQEKRILAAVLAVVTVLVSVFFVWPKLDQWKASQNALQNARKKLQQYQAEIGRIPVYEARLRELEGQGSAVLPEEQALELMRTIQTQANLHSVPITSTRVGTAATSTSSTNVFFDEQIVNVGVNTSEEPLVNFLYSLGTGNSMIRVRDMDLRPDPPRFKLNGSITLVASYQKKPKPTRPAAAPAVATPLPAAATTNRIAPPKP